MPFAVPLHVLHAETATNHESNASACGRRTAIHARQPACKRACGLPVAKLTLPAKAGASSRGGDGTSPSPSQGRLCDPHVAVHQQRGGAAPRQDPHEGAGGPVGGRQPRRRRLPGAAGRGRPGPGRGRSAAARAWRRPSCSAAAGAACRGARRLCDEESPFPGCIARTLVDWLLDHSIANDRVACACSMRRVVHTCVRSRCPLGQPLLQWHASCTELRERAYAAVLRRLRCRCG